MSAMPIQSRNGGSVHLQSEELEQFRAGLRGTLIQPLDDSYDDARKVYNAMHDRRPALIIQAVDEADVMQALKFAHRHDLLVAVRGGGHSVPGFGTCDDGLVLDLGRMKGIRVDTDKQTVRAQAGCTWGDLDHATNGFGMATPGGVVSTTGIAGLTLGGGMGHLSRRCGLACDNLVSADVVTADGTSLTCNEKNHSDLFWAIRGGGGNFGVVTSFEYRLHPIAEILGGPTFYEVDSEVLSNYEELLETAPEELGLMFAVAQTPPLPFVPERWHGRPVMAVVACWSGANKEDEKIISTVGELGTVVGQALWRMPYPMINTLFDELLPPGLLHYWKANFTHTVSGDASAVHTAHGSKVPTLESGTFFIPINGACHRRSPDDMAFAHRDVTHSVVIAGTWNDTSDNDKNIAWVRDYYNALRPYSEEGGYVNFMSDDDQAKAPSNYGANYQRLRQIKAAYDPKNLFSLNQNIAPQG